MNTYKIEYSFEKYNGKERIRTTENINAPNAKLAVIILKTNYIFDDTIQIENVWINNIKNWDFVNRSEWED